MVRAVHIPSDVTEPIREVNVTLSGEFSDIRLTTLDEGFIHVDQELNMFVQFVSSDDLPENRPLRNERASALYSRASMRDFIFILGDAYIVGEDIDEEGAVCAVDLDTQIGPRDIEDLIEYHSRR